MREEVFFPKIKTNQDTTNIVIDLNKVLAEAMLKEFEAKGAGKVARHYITVLNGIRCYDRMKAAGRLLLWKKATVVARSDAVSKVGGSINSQ